MFVPAPGRFSIVDNKKGTTDQACGYFSTFGGPGSALKEATSAWEGP